MNLRESINKRIDYLQMIAGEKRQSLAKAPEGMVKGNRHGTGWQYYYRKTSGEKNGIYIKKKNISLAKALGQKEYDNKVLRVTEKELKLLNQLAAVYEQGTLEEIYQHLPASHWPIVCPVEVPIGEFVEQWQDISYQSKAFAEDAPLFYTNKGERVRSKSEMLIANLLAYHNIPYHYEKPIYLKGYGTVYPDFTVLDVQERKEIYWEHMGLLDDRDYREKALDKIATYIMNDYMPGDQLILTYETGRQPLNMKVIEKIVEQYVS